MEATTTIHSNGSKWAGEAPDSIDKLIDILKSHTIEERFFTQYKKFVSTGVYVSRNLCPIDENTDGSVRFFGNFEDLSHVFRIDTNDSEIISKLSEAIKNNSNLIQSYGKHGIMAIKRFDTSKDSFKVIGKKEVILFFGWDTHSIEQLKAKNFIK